MPSLSFSGLLRPILLFLAAFLVLVPLRWQWRTSKLPAFALIAWLFVTNIINAVGSIVWMEEAGTGLRDEMSKAAMVYCDIATKIIVGSWTAVPAALLCIAQRLRLASKRDGLRRNGSVMHTRRDNFVDAVICFGVPVVFMALHYIVQDHRFDLIETIGCQPAVLHSVPSVFIIWIPALFLSFMTLVLAALAIHSFLSTRPSRARTTQTWNISKPHLIPATMPTFTPTNIHTPYPHRPSHVPLASPPSPPYPPCLFVRLITLAALGVSVVIGLTIADIVYTTMSGKMSAYPSFSEVHKGMSRVDVFFLSRLGEAQQPVHFIQLLTWTAPAPAAAYIFFLTVSHWCECVRFLAKIGGFGRWFSWKLARLRGWLKGEKVFEEEESVHEQPIGHTYGRSISSTYTATTISQPPSYTSRQSFTAHPFPMRPSTKPPPPPLLLTHSNHMIPHALRPSSLYGGPAQVEARGVVLGREAGILQEMGGRAQGHSSRTSTGRPLPYNPSTPPDMTYVYSKPSRAATVSSRVSTLSWAGFPMVEPGTSSQEYVIPEPPPAASEYSRVSLNRGKRASTRERHDQRRQQSVGYGRDGAGDILTSSYLYVREHVLDTARADNGRNGGDVDAPVRIPVGSRPVALSRAPIAQPVTLPTQVPAQVALTTSAPVSTEFTPTDSSASSFSSGRSHPASTALVSESAASSELHRTPTTRSRRTSVSGTSSVDVPKYHMPSRLVSPRSEASAEGSASVSGIESDSTTESKKGSGMAGIGSGRWGWGER